MHLECVFLLLRFSHGGSSEIELAFCICDGADLWTV